MPGTSHIHSARCLSLYTAFPGSVEVDVVTHSEVADTAGHRRPPFFFMAVKIVPLFVTTERFIYLVTTP